MPLTCQLCGKRLEGVIAYDKHIRLDDHGRGSQRTSAPSLVRVIVGLAIAREITKEK